MKEFVMVESWAVMSEILQVEKTAMKLDSSMAEKLVVWTDFW
jgi:hypothetical protein